MPLYQVTLALSFEHGFKNVFKIADVLILSSSLPDGIAYIETKNLDGETNLKLKRACSETSHIQDPAVLLATRLTVEAEGPHPHLYTFNGSIRMQGQSTSTAIGPSNILLRGCILRNASVYALVLYVGSDTKLVLNSGTTPSKRSAIEIEMNKEVMLNCVVLVLLCVVIAGMAISWESSIKGSNALFLATSYSATEGL